MNREELYKVHAPIGLEIGAVAVAEIAVSIAAELVAAQRGFAETMIRPMKMDQEEVDRWLERGADQ